MEYNEYYLLPREDRWLLKTPGVIKPLKTFQDLSAAREFARRLEQNQEARVRVQLQTGEWKGLAHV
ncbi:hypothetical protein DC28_10815 [Spirochaeta lutea]|uniref:DUF2188 domain-containing protein n=2 Tax=Spirochaeta lutea TaxID=1480694 RepID=A0A098QZ09_9SPIO|nr:hypothetical protein DC28_10815 [Spirochaeta lutea]